MWSSPPPARHASVPSAVTGGLPHVTFNVSSLRRMHPSLSLEDVACEMARARADVQRAQFGVGGTAATGNTADTPARMVTRVLQLLQAQVERKRAFEAEMRARQVGVTAADRALPAFLQPHLNWPQTRSPRQQTTPRRIRPQPQQQSQQLQSPRSHTPLSPSSPHSAVRGPRPAPTALNAETMSVRASSASSRPLTSASIASTVVSPRSVHLSHDHFPMPPARAAAAHQSPRGRMRRHEARNQHAHPTPTLDPPLSTALPHPPVAFHAATARAVPPARSAHDDCSASPLTPSGSRRLKSTIRSPPQTPSSPLAPYVSAAASTVVAASVTEQTSSNGRSALASHSTDPSGAESAVPQLNDVAAVEAAAVAAMPPALVALPMASSSAPTADSEPSQSAADSETHQQSAMENMMRRRMARQASNNEQKRKSCVEPPPPDDALPPVQQDTNGGEAISVQTEQQQQQQQQQSEVAGSQEEQENVAPVVALAEDETAASDAAAERLEAEKRAADAAAAAQAQQDAASAAEKLSVESAFEARQRVAAERRAAAIRIQALVRGHQARQEVAVRRAVRERFEQEKREREQDEERRRERRRTRRRTQKVNSTANAALAVVVTAAPAMEMMVPVQPLVQAQPFVEVQPLVAVQPAVPAQLRVPQARMALQRTVTRRETPCVEEVTVVDGASLAVVVRADDDEDSDDSDDDDQPAPGQPNSQSAPPAAASAMSITVSPNE